MKLWISKESLKDMDGGLQILAEPPIPEEEEEYWLFTTQEEHYFRFVEMLDVMAEDAREIEDYRTERLCLELAGKFKAQIPHNKMAN